MTTYTAIPNSDIDPESPLTTSLITLLRDNPLAIQEGDATAPAIAWAALANAPGAILLETVTADNVTEAAFSADSLTSTYDHYYVMYDNVYGANDQAELELQVYESAAWKTSGYGYDVKQTYITEATYSSNNASSSSIQVAGNLPNDGTYKFNGIIRFTNPDSTADHTTFYGRGWGQADTTNDTGVSEMMGEYGNVGAITNLKLKMSSGNIYGTFRLYGAPK